MSKGNIDNLRRLTSEEAREIGSKGGKASVKARREKKLFKEIFLAQIEEVVTIDGKDITKQVAMCQKQVDKAVDGDLEALQFIRDSVGEKPRAMVHMSGGMEFNSGGLTETLKVLKKKD